jgi:hypothetical protein
MSALFKETKYSTRGGGRSTRVQDFDDNTRALYLEEIELRCHVMEKEVSCDVQLFPLLNLPVHFIYI